MSKSKNRACQACGAPCDGKVCGDCFEGGTRGTACEVCGEALKAHARCSGCGILAGPAHVVKALTAAGTCPSCEAWRRKQRSLAQGVMAL